MSSAILKKSDKDSFPLCPLFRRILVSQERKGEQQVLCPYERNLISHAFKRDINRVLQILFPDYPASSQLNLGWTAPDLRKLDICKGPRSLRTQQSGDFIPVCGRIRVSRAVWGNIGVFWKHQATKFEWFLGMKNIGKIQFPQPYLKNLWWISSKMTYTVKNEVQSATF